MGVSFFVFVRVYMVVAVTIVDNNQFQQEL